MFYRCMGFENVFLRVTFMKEDVKLDDDDDHADFRYNYRDNMKPQFK